MNTPLSTCDPEIDAYIQLEQWRQQYTINLIASENYASQAILQATGSILTNKYAEGYPGKRYYAGCLYIDEIEKLAQDRCKTLFKAEHVNVQPHAGSQANMAAIFALAANNSWPYCTILSMDMRSGGHLTHGSPVNFSGHWYTVEHYGVHPETELLDYEAIFKIADKRRPEIIIAGASSYTRTIDFKKFADIAQSVNAVLVADIAHIAGFIATGLHSTPVGYAQVTTGTTHKTLRGPRGGFILTSAAYQEKIDRAVMPGVQGGPCMHTIAAKAVCFKQAATPEFVEYQKQVLSNARALCRALQALQYEIVSGGTDTHMLVVKLHNTLLTGTQVTKALEKAGITVSKSSVPSDLFDSPWGVSGIRIGTPAVTTRGMKEPQMEQIASWIDAVIKNYANEQILAAIKTEVEQLCKDFNME